MVGQIAQVVRRSVSFVISSSEKSTPGPAVHSIVALVVVA